MRPDLGPLTFLLAPFMPTMDAWFNPNDHWNYVGGEFDRYFRGPHVLTVRVSPANWSFRCGRSRGQPCLFLCLRRLPCSRQPHRRGEPVASSTIIRLPLAGVSSVGLKVTETLQLLPDASVVAHRDVTTNTDGDALSISILTAGPVFLLLAFLILTVFGLLVVPTVVLSPNAIEPGVIVSVAETGVGVEVGVWVAVGVAVGVAAVAVAVGVALRVAVTVGVADVAVAVGVPQQGGVAVTVGVGSGSSNFSARLLEKSDT
jgi:hypothetical protein